MYLFMAQLQSIKSFNKVCITFDFIKYIVNAKTSFYSVQYEIV